MSKPSWFETAPRPLLRWVCLFGAAWAMGVCDMFGVEMDGTVRGVILAFVAAVYGLRGWEKIKTQAPEPEAFAMQDNWNAPYSDTMGGYEPAQYRNRGQM